MNKLRISVIIGVLCLGAVVQHNAAAAVFAQYDGVDGESTDADHVNWIDVLSVSWGTTQAVSHRTDPRGGRRALEPGFSDLTMLKTLDKSSPKLMVACAAGTRFATVNIDFTSSMGDAPQSYLLIEMTDVVI